MTYYDININTVIPDSSDDEIDIRVELHYIFYIGEKTYRGKSCKSCLVTKNDEIKYTSHIPSTSVITKLKIIFKKRYHRVYTYYLTKDDILRNEINKNHLIMLDIKFGTEPLIVVNNQFDIDPPIISKYKRYWLF